LSGSGLEQFQAAVRRQLEARQKPSKQDAAALRKQLARLDSEIEQAADNFLRAPADLLEIIGTKLSAMKRQRQDLAEALQRATKPVREATSTGKLKPSRRDCGDWARSWNKQNRSDAGSYSICWWTESTYGSIKSDAASA
jgi:hypothetical protein